MDDNKMRILLGAIRTGSFKGGAGMNLHQSAVTQAMNSLENELGCRGLLLAQSLRYPADTGQ